MKNSQPAADRQQRRAVMYLRTAQQHQGSREPESIVRQRNICRRLADYYEATIVEEYVDIGTSGAHLDRPGLTQLTKRLLQNPRVHYLIVSDRDRLSRDVVHSLVILRALDASDVELLMPTFLKSTERPSTIEQEAA